MESYFITRNCESALCFRRRLLENIPTLTLPIIVFCTSNSIFLKLTSVHFRPVRQEVRKKIVNSGKFVLLFKLFIFQPNSFLTQLKIDQFHFRPVMFSAKELLLNTELMFIQNKVSNGFKFTKDQKEMVMNMFILAENEKLAEIKG